MIFDENHQKSYHFYCKTQRFQNVILTYQNLNFSNGITWYSDERKKWSENIAICSQIYGQFVKFNKMAIDSAANSNVFWSLLSFIRISSNPIGKVKILISQNRVLKTLCFAIEMTWFLMNCMKMLHFHYDYKWFLIAIFTFQNLYLV